MGDIPRGQFICGYVGELLTEQQAEENGELFGDSYIADLNFFKVVQEIKDGYGSDAAQMDTSSSDGL